MSAVKIGIIGGTGLDNPSLLYNRQEKYVDTPFGKPSDALIEGTIFDVECVLLARHGRNHTISPTNINYRANIWALQKAGCTHIIATSACGSLKEEIKPGHIAFPDQFIDRTVHRMSTFYDGKPGSLIGVCHLPMHTPFCMDTREILLEAAKHLGYTYHTTGTVVTIEGPRFSTRAESELYRSWNADLVGMTLVPEVVLAKEIGICYASIALATDYDCWHQSEAKVCVDDVMKIMKENSHKALEIIKHSILKIAEKDWAETIKTLKDEVAASVMV
ncbi:MTAP [Cordylochernes scorpioides]|uniref:S-methyl-5'-thioadenosine phosphorylase n=1 Tax=Cordylochernes scorpioides TaxID=51811 RepID=A0ABY6LL21_9ARAC|nr:MTAP [Cordylochernes scorpioides]